MINVIENQHVARRRRPSQLSGVLRHTASSHGFDLIQQIKQKPAPSRRGRTGNTVAAFRPARPRFSLFDSDRPARPVKSRREQPVSGGTRPAPRRGGGGFSFPVPSPMSLAVIAGTLVVSLLALNWEGISLSVPQPENFALQPGPDGESRRNLASYAGISGVALPLVEAPAERAETPETVEADIPLDLTETFNWTSYQVKKGDSVSKIAAKFAISMDAIIASNNISNARRLPEGKSLRIPNMDGIPYTVKKGDNLSKIAKSQGIPLEVILDANDIRSDTIAEGTMLFLPGARMAPEALKLALGELFIYPLQNRRITSPFGWRISPITGTRHYHAALDLAGATGTPVKAAMDGTVSTVGYNPTYGNFIILSHDGAYQSMYAHLSATSVKQGIRVSQGGKIGEVGSTGLSTGSHLHFAVYKNGRPVNPLELLN